MLLELLTTHCVNKSFVANDISWALLGGPSIYTDTNEICQGATTWQRKEDCEDNRHYKVRTDEKTGMRRIRIQLSVRIVETHRTSFGLTWPIRKIGFIMVKQNFFGGREAWRWNCPFILEALFHLFFYFFLRMCVSWKWVWQRVLIGCSSQCVWQQLLKEVAHYAILAICIFDDVIARTGFPGTIEDCGRVVVSSNLSKLVEHGQDKCASAG